MQDDLEIQAETTLMKYKPLVSVTKLEEPAKRSYVKLKLMGTCFVELWEVLGHVVNDLSASVEKEPWLTIENALIRSELQVLMDVYELHLERYAMRKPPAVVTVSMSRAEAYLFWHCLMWHQPPRETCIALATLLDELHRTLP